MTYRSSHRRCSVKTDVLKIFQILQESNCVGVSFGKVAGLQAVADLVTFTEEVLNENFNFCAALEKQMSLCPLLFKIY